MIRRARPEEADTLAALFRRSYRTLTFLPILHTPEEDREHALRARPARAIEGVQLLGLPEERGRAPLLREARLRRRRVHQGRGERGERAGRPLRVAPEPGVRPRACRIFLKSPPSCRF